MSENDITNRVAMEARLHQLEHALSDTIKEKARLEATLAAIGDGVRIMGRDFRILYQNRVDKDIVGDHAGEHCHMAFQRRGQVCEGCHLFACFQDGKIHKKDQVLPTKKGIKYNEITASPLPDETGTIVAGIEIVRDVTERRRAEEALQAAEQKYRSLIELTDTGFVIIDEAGFVRDANQKYAELSGHQCPADIIGRSVFEWTAPADRDRNVFAVSRCRDHGFVRNFEVDYISSSGGTIPVEINATVIREEGVTSIISLCRAITDRRRRESRLKEINAAILKLDEHDHAGNLNALTTLCGKLLGADCALYNRMDGNLLCVRGEWAAPSDLKKEDAPQGHICFDVIRRESDVPLVVRNLGNTIYAKTDPNVAAYGLQTYIGCRVQYSGITRGSLCAVFTRDYMPSSDDLDVISIIASAVAQEEDRYAAIEKLRESELFIRKILNTVDEGFIVINRDYRILTANNAYCSQVSLPCDEVIGRHCFGVSHRKSRPCYEEGEDCVIQRVFETGEPHATLHKHIDGDGQVLYVETKGFPIKDVAGNVTSAIETVNNITEKHLLEEERLKTQKLESVGTLAGGIAHDFNNLLQGVFGYISMARMTIHEKDRALSMLEQADNALQQSVNLTTQLLTFAKGGKPVKKLINLSPAIANSTKFALSGSRSDSHVNIPDDLWKAEADEGQVGQVVHNIVLNADQSMPIGGTVTVTAKNIAEGDSSLPAGLAPGNYVMISVQDTGVGIPEQYINRIFDPYFTTKEKGSGLGLATSYSIIKNHGGMIEVRAKSGEGSTFNIYLPAIAGMDRTQFTDKPTVSSLTRTARVLLMDDEELIRNLSIELLGSLGHEVDVAKDGQQALDMYQGAMDAGKPFDLVILDLTVRGGMGGVETFRKLQEIDPSVMAIVSSGYSDDASITNYLSFGFKAFLKKPYNVRLLRDSVQTLLS